MCSFGHPMRSGPARLAFFKSYCELLPGRKVEATFEGVGRLSKICPAHSPPFVVDLLRFGDRVM